MQPYKLMQADQCKEYLLVKPVKGFDFLSNLNSLLPFSFHSPDTYGPRRWLSWYLPSDIDDLGEVGNRIISYFSV